MVTKLLHTRYRVADLEKTLAFYKDVLGLEEVRRHKSPRGSELVFLKAPQSEEHIEICCFPASGPVVVGPDLTHLAGRRGLAANAMPNQHAYLSAWATRAQSLKPGAQMPPNSLAPADLRALVAYMEALR